jgi:hypothetical protein
MLSYDKYIVYDSLYLGHEYFELPLANETKNQHCVRHILRVYSGFLTVVSKHLF